MEIKLMQTGTIESEEFGHESNRRVYSEEGLSPSLTTMDGGNREPKIEKSNLRIRKLTPRECWRLMGFSDEDFDKAKAVNSDSRLYMQAGNSICVNVLEAIFGQMVDKKETPSATNEEMPILAGGVGEMKSNSGTQYYQQNRVYDSNSIALCQSAHEQFNPYYLVEDEDEID